MTKKLDTFKIGFISVGVISFVMLLSFVGVNKADASIFTSLSLGSKGADVTQLQQFLAADRSIYPQGVVSGYFGLLTQAAVVQFQAAYGLPQVGVVGHLTSAAINNVMALGVPLNTSAPMISGVWVQANRNSTTVSWSVDKASKGQLYYDVYPIQSNEATGPFQLPYISGMFVSNNQITSGTQSLTLQNLNPSTTYHYVVRVIDNLGNVSMTMPMLFNTNQ